MSGRSLSRRRLLGLGATGLATAGLATCGLTGCSLDAPPRLPGLDQAPRERPQCVARTSLTRYTRLADLPLIYEVNRRRSPFWIEQGFAAQLTAWLTDLGELTGWRGRQLWTYGTWTDGGSSCSSWHNAGRAFDLARLRLDDGSEVSCRYDRWRRTGARELAAARRRYWAIAASAHQHFAYVLTYPYDAQHHNHIHIDNGRSGGGRSQFTGRSRVQLHAVQAICSYLWDRPTPITGRWDAATRRASQQVLEGLGVRGALTDAGAWASFLAASTRRGAEPA